MKKQNILLLSFIALVSACGSNNPVSIAKAPETKSEYQPEKKSPFTYSERVVLPKDVTAICRDGSYSTTPTEQACFNNGGIKERVFHFYSE